MEISPEWILASYLTLAGAVATMAKLIYSNLAAQIETQGMIIKRLQYDIDRLSEGCGSVGCPWLKTSH